MQPRPRFHVLGNLPTPMRWTARELLRLVTWVDHGAGRFLEHLRASPAWGFVVLVGILGVGLTILLFISVIEQTSAPRARTVSHASTHLSRAHLEKNHEWSAQDRWRVAHMFVPHKPAEPFKNIQIDSRLMTESPRAEAPSPFEHGSVAARSVKGKEVEVRMDTHRPKQAQQGRRLISETSLNSATFHGQSPSTQSRIRDPRLLVQAAWEFNADCGRQVDVPPPIRRPIHLEPFEPVSEIPVPVPVPRREILPERVPTTSPHLEIDSVLVRHFTTAGAFPDGSKLVSHSVRSEFFFEDPPSRNELASYSHPVWHRPGHVRREHVDNAVHYVAIGIHEATLGMMPTSDMFDPSLPSATDVSLFVELVSSHSQTRGRSHESRLVIRNDGVSSIPRIELEDLISPPRTIVAAEPDATSEEMADPDSGVPNHVLHRKIEGLAAGDSQEFALTWIPEPGQTNVHRAMVIAEASVSKRIEVIAAQTDETEQIDLVDQQMPSIPPEDPPEINPVLACDLNYPETAYVGDELELHLTVRNTGDAPLHNVQVRIELPEQFSHPEGKVVVFNAGRLAVGGRNQTHLKLSAQQTGRAVNVLHISADEQVQARGRANILVEQRPKEPAARPVPVEPVRPTPLTTSLSTSQPSPKRTLVAGSCCCQQSTAIRTTPINSLR